MVRLVFRPYARVVRSICTSEPLRASTRVSPGFALPGRSSPSFGYQQVRCGSVRLRRLTPDGERRTGRRCASPLPRRRGSRPTVSRASTRGALTACRRFEPKRHETRREARMPTERGGTRPPDPRNTTLAPEPAPPDPAAERMGRLDPTARAPHTFIAPPGFRSSPSTRARVRLLGPCFKTGRVGFRPSPQTPSAGDRTANARHDTREEDARAAGKPERGEDGPRRTRAPPKGPDRRTKPSARRPRGRGNGPCRRRTAPRRRTAVDDALRTVRRQSTERRAAEAPRTRETRPLSRNHARTRRGVRLLFPSRFPRSRGERTLSPGPRDGRGPGGSPTTRSGATQRPPVAGPATAPRQIAKLSVEKPRRSWPPPEPVAAHRTRRKCTGRRPRPPRGEARPHVDRDRRSAPDPRGDG